MRRKWVRFAERLSAISGQLSAREDPPPCSPPLPRGDGWRGRPSAARKVRFAERPSSSLSSIGRAGATRYASPQFESPRVIRQPQVAAQNGFVLQNGRQPSERSAFSRENPPPVVPLAKGGVWRGRPSAARNGFVLQNGVSISGRFQPERTHPCGPPAKGGSRSPRSRFWRECKRPHWRTSVRGTLRRTPANGSFWAGREDLTTTTPRHDAGWFFLSRGPRAGRTVEMSKSRRSARLIAHNAGTCIAPRALSRPTGTIRV